MAASVPSQVSAGAEAIVAAGAIARMVLAEMAQNRLSAAGGGFAQRQQRLELAALDPLDLVGRFALLDHAATLHHVGQPERHVRLGGEAIATGAPGLLVIGLDRGRHVEMRDIAHIRLVDAHAERDGGDKADRVLLEECILVARADLRRQPGVIGQRGNALFGQPLGGLFDLLAAAGNRRCRSRRLWRSRKASSCFGPLVRCTIE